jgi:hypothetical protein
VAYETNGEHLANFLRHRHLGDDPGTWNQLGIALLPTGRAKEWVDAVQDMTALHLTRRLVSAGISIVNKYGDIDSVAERELQQMVLETMIIDYFVVGEVVVRLAPAIRAARRDISGTTRTQLEGFARREMPFCYLCGTDLVFDEPGPTRFTIDHVWPRAYGGDSEPENLLPACQSCNNRKGMTPSWSMYPVQALVAGFEIDSADVALLPKEMRFAMHAREVAACAVDKRVSLKEAFVALGRVDVPTVINRSVTVDVFNLAFAAR